MQKWNLVETMGLILEDDPQFFQRRAYSERTFQAASSLERAIREGNIEDIERLLPSLYRDIALAKRINRLVCKSPKAFKRGTFGRHIRIYEGKFTLPDAFSHSRGLAGVILRWTRLAEHAVIRVRKHPLYKEI
jgi:hypothetical protein